MLAALALAACEEGPTAPERPERVVLLTIDTLRADRVGCYGAEGARTPTLDDIAARGVRFEQAISPAPLTLPSHATLLTGLDPPQHGVRDNSIFQLAEDIPTLAERLREAGFATAAFVGALVLDGRHGLDRGFETYGDHLGVGAAGEGTAQFPSRRADAVVDEAVTWIESAPSRFLLWVHVFDPHAEYDPPEPFRSAFPDSPYDGEIAFADFELGRLLRAVDARWPDGATLVVATSDHGESLGEHAALTHGLAVYDTTQRVPLLMAGPGIPVGGTVSAVVRLADLAPTLLAGLGLPEFPKASGADLGPLLRGEAADSRVAYVETLAPRLLFDWSPLLGVRNAQYKYIRAPRPELYELATDPGERSNLATRRPERVQEMERLLENALVGRRSVEAQLAPSARDRERLETLGYGVGEVAGADEGAVAAGLADPKDKRTEAGAYFRAQQLARAGRNREALALLEESAPAESGVLFATLRARLLLALGRAEEAEALARVVIARGGRGDAAHRVLGRALAMQGRTDEAVAAMEEAVVLNPTRAGPLLALGELRREQGDLEGAERFYRRALATPDGSVGARLLLAALLLDEQRPDEADAVLAEVPDDTRPTAPQILRLVDAEVGAGRERRALERLREAVVREPDSVALAFAHSELTYRLRDTAALVASAEHAFRLDPESPLAQNNLAWVLLEAGADLDRARVLARRACAAEPRDANFRDTLASIYLARGEVGAALEESERGLVVAVNGARAHLLYLRSAALQALGDRAEAALSLEQAFEAMGDELPAEWLPEASALAQRLDLSLPAKLRAARAPSKPAFESLP